MVKAKCAKRILFLHLFRKIFKPKILTHYSVRLHTWLSSECEVHILVRLPAAASDGAVWGLVACDFHLIHFLCFWILIKNATPAE